MQEWIGVDLDGTLAHYDEWKGPQHIGHPIKQMVDRVKRWVRDGEIVKIFTARASVTSQITFVEKWLRDNGLPALEVTNIKDMWMIELWDDRCVQVEQNTGRVIGSTTRIV